jgi:hypothetical protein
MLPGTVSQLTALSIQVLFAIVAIGLAWAFSTAFYNVYFHPLAHFPGPRLAAASKFWLAYQEFIRGVSLSDVRDELHATYGETSLPRPVRSGLSDTNQIVIVRRHHPPAT